MQCPLPTHDDRLRQDNSGSFSVNAEESLFLCFGCGAKGNAHQLHQILSGSLDFMLENASQGEREVAPEFTPPKTPQPAAAKPTRPRLQGVTLAQLAEAKGLDPDYLYEELAWREHRYYGVPAMLSYPDENNQDPQVRYRVGLDEGDRFRWERGAKPRLYGAVEP